MSSEKILNAKKQIVAGLTEEFKSAKTLVLAEYLGLTVAQDTDLRNRLREAGVEYKVVKNTMAVLAAREAGLEDLEELFKGPTAVAYSTDDVIAPAKVLKKFEKENEIFKVKGGASDGAVVSLDYLNELAAVPDLEVLYGKVVGSLISPIAGLAMLVKAIAEKCEEQGLETAAAAAVEKSEEAPEAEAPAAAEETEEKAPAEAAE